MKRLFVAALSLAVPMAVFGDTVFDDTFGSGSTLNTANTTPSGGNSTGYQVASTKSASSSLNPGDLQMSFASTSSGLAELQALFTTSPVTLASVGDSITLSITFKDTSGLLIGGSSFLSGGLYNSGGAGPVASGGLAASGLAGTALPTGNAAGWNGYIGRINGNGNSSQIALRAAQVGATNNAAQDLVGNGFSTTGGYHNPTGTALHSATSAVGTLTTGDTFNYTLSYTLSAAGTLTIADSLTDTTLSSLLFSDSATATGASLLTTTFDGLAFGDRTATTGVANTIDFNEILITDNIQSVPEPSTLAVAAVGGLFGLVFLGRRRS